MSSRRPSRYTKAPRRRSRPGKAQPVTPADYDPTDAEQGPLEQGWAKSRQYDLEHRKEDPGE